MEQFNAIFRENIKRFIAYLLVFIMFFSILFPASVIAEEAQTDPEPEFEFLNGEITGYNGTETDVVIPETIGGEAVTAIGNNAFRNKGLTSIIIPNTVKTIGMQAFAQNNLTSIELPGNLTEMGNMAFAKNQLISVILPETLKNIPTGAFYDNQLTSVTIPEGVTHIAKIAFANNQLTSVIIPKSTEYMFSDSFKGNDNINLTYTLLVETLEGSKNIDTKGKTGESVQALKEAITEGEEVNQKPLATLDEVKEVVKKINDAIDALEDESGVKSSIKEIEPLEDIEVSLGTSEYEAKAKLPDKAIIIDSNNQKYKVDVTWLISDYDGNAVGEYTAEGIFELPEGVVQPDPPIELKVIVKIIVKSGEVQDEEWGIEDFTYEGTTITGFSENGKEKFKTNKHIVLPAVNKLGEPITEIGDRAFLGEYSTMKDPKVGINSVKIPDTVEIIGKEAFRYNCLTEIDIPDSVTTIRESAFNGNKLQSLVIPDSVIEIGSGAFTLNEIANLKLSNSLTTIPTAFSYNNLTTVSIPEGVTRIDDLAFSDNQLTEVKFPSTLKYLSGFNNNNFTSITIPENVTELGKRAFARNKITSVTIPGNVKIIGENAFWNTWHDDYLDSVIIEEGVEVIDKYAFSNNKLKDVNLPSSIRALHEKAFYQNEGYDGVVHLYTPNYENKNNLLDSNYHVINPAKIIVKYVFNDEVLKEEQIWKNLLTGEYYRIGDKDVEIIPEYDDNKYELVSNNPVTINLENKETQVVFRCRIKEVVEEVRIKAIDQVTPIVVDYGTPKEMAIRKLPYRTYIIDSKNQAHKVNLTWILEEYNGNIAGEYEAIGTFKLPEGISQSNPETKLEVVGKIIVKDKYAIPVDSEWEIEDFTYEDTTITGFSEKGLEKLTENKVLVLPEVNERGEKITCIGKRAFKNRQLTTVVIPEGLDGLIIEEGAFQDNQIEKVFIPEGVKEIDTYAFKNNRIRYIEFPGTLKKIGNNAFSDNGLICILFSKDTEDIAIDNYSFANNELINVTILKKVRKIAPDAFINNMGNGKDNKVYIYTLSEKNKWFDVSDYFKIITLAVESVEELGAIEVDYGTKIDNVNLPKKITLYLNDGEKVEVNVIWTSKDYDGNKAGEYKFIGSYDLPEGMAGEKPEISIKVVVKEELEQPKEPKEPEFPTETESPVAPEMPKKPQKPVQSEETKKTEQPKKSEELKEEISTEEITFVDLDDVPWAKKAIENLAEKGIVVGFGNNEFRPKDKLTRAQFAAILVRAFNIETTTGHSKFDDVKESHWYYEAVMNLANLKIVSGDGTGNFNPNGNITREQMIKLLIEVINIKYPEYLNTKGNLNGFKDSSTISDWAVEYMEKAVGLGLINGFEDSTIRPKEEATRAQAAVIIDRILSLLK
ncbi:leucine-rich repeat protein [Tepidimicrobium xylanilyticum]